jgi:N4-gp56 family major capsid protein
MSWSDDFFGTAGSTPTYATYGSNTSVGAGIITYYMRKFLETLVPSLYFVQAGMVAPLPKGNGQTVEWFRWVSLAMSSNIITALGDGALPNAQGITTQKISASIAEYGGFGQLTKLLTDTHIDRECEGAVDLFAAQAALGLDIISQKAVGSIGNALRCDFTNTPSATFRGLLTSDSASTTFICSSLTTNTDFGDANDDLNQAVVTVLSGTGAGQSRVITDYVASTGTGTVAAWDTTPKSGDMIRISSPHNLTKDDKLNYECLVRAYRMLTEGKAPKYEGNAYGLLVHPGSYEHLKNDKNFLDVEKYRDRASNGIYNGEVGMMAGFRIFEHTNPYVFPICGKGTNSTSYGPGSAGANFSFNPGVSYSSPQTGWVANTYAFGKNAFGVTGFADEIGRISKPPIIIRTPGPQTTSQPIPRYSTIAWYVRFVAKMLQPLWFVPIWTGYESY